MLQLYYIQWTLVISTSLISNNRLSRSENLVPVLTQISTNKQQNIVEKRRNCSLGAIYFSSFTQYFQYSWGWSGGAKVLCILDHRGVQLILAYSWARPAILVVGKGRGGMFLFLLFLHFHSCSSFFPVPLFHLLYSLFYLFSPFLWETTQNDPQGLTCR